MYDKRVFLKTLKGLREVSGSTNDLSGDLRAVLKEIDGKIALGEVMIKLDLPEAAFQATIKRFISEKYITEAEKPKVGASLVSSGGGDEGEDLDFTFMASSVSAANEQKEAEEQARKEAEAQAKKAAEEEARKEAEEKARREAEEKARKEAEEKARRQAEEKARGEAEAKAKKEAEEKARREAEEQARKEAEAQAKKAAEEKARKEAEEKAKREAEEKARSEAEAKTKKEAEEKARREAEEQARKEAEARAAEEAALREIEEEEEKPAPKQGPAQPAQVVRETGKLPGKPLKLGKYIAVAVVLLVVVGLALIHLMPFNGRIPQFEKSASAALQQPVKIGSLNFALFPQPHWRLQSVSIGGEAQVKIVTARALTDFSGLFSEDAVLKALVLDSVSVNAEGLGMLLFARPEIKSSSLRRLEINKAKLETGLVAFPEFNGSVEIGEGGQWQKINVRAEEGQIKFDLQAKGDKIGIEFSADALALPREAVLKFKEIEASGEAGRDGLTLSEFRGRLYDGVLVGSVRLKWKPEWLAEGVLDAKGLEVAAMLAKVFGGGKLDGKATYALRGSNADQLFAAPRLEGNFVIHNGILHGVDLKQVIKGEIGSGPSVFNEVAGEFLHEGGVTQFPKVNLTAGLISAAGKVSVQADKKVQGQFEVELKSSLMKARANLGISGTTEEVRYSR